MKKELQNLLNFLLANDNQVEIIKCSFCDGQGWITLKISDNPLKTVTENCKRCNSSKTPNPYYRAKFN